MLIQKNILRFFLLLSPAITCALGVHDGLLSPCNNRWNCVITQEVDGQNPALKPIKYNGSRADALAQLKKVLLSFDRVQIITETDEYIYATFATKLLGFVDDVECYAPIDEKVIHMRSASRVGKYDLGVNKRRIKAIKDRFNAAQ